MRRVLCIDDDPERLRRIGQATLEVGAEPLEAATLRRALRLAASADVAVAAGGGLEVLEHLCRHRPALPRVAVAKAESAEALLALISVAHPYSVLPETFEVGALAEVLRQTFELHLLQVSVGDTTRRRVMPRPANFAQLITCPTSGAHAYPYLRLRLEEELDRASRYSRPLSLMFADLDGLRALNDGLGRAAGDQALKQVASVLTQNARGSDRVGRWTGGCFVVVLPETPVGAAYGIAERVRSEIAGRRFTVQASGASMPLRITVSVGVASTGSKEGAHPSTLVQRADAALLRAKRGGANRAVADG
jgi:diguanylate cyclase (GGDEF)-like protein